jgi:hypothetical protein
MSAGRNAGRCELCDMTWQGNHKERALNEGQEMRSAASWEIRMRDVCLRRRGRRWERLISWLTSFVINAFYSSFKFSNRTCFFSSRPAVKHEWSMEKRAVKMLQNTKANWAVLILQLMSCATLWFCSLVSWSAFGRKKMSHSETTHLWSHVTPSCLAQGCFSLRNTRRDHEPNLWKPQQSLLILMIRTRLFPSKSGSYEILRKDMQFYAWNPLPVADGFVTRQLFRWVTGDWETFETRDWPCNQALKGILILRHGEVGNPYHLLRVYFSIFTLF